MGVERRKTYRAESEPGAQVELRKAAGVTSARSQLMDSSIGGIGASESIDSAHSDDSVLSASVGQSLVVCIAAPGFGAALEMPATVVWRSDAHEVQRRGLCFDAKPEPGRRDPSDFYRCFNRREVRRFDVVDEEIRVAVAPGPPGPVPNRAQWAGLSGRLVDIATQGLALRISHPADRVVAAAGCEGLRVGFDLPGRKPRVVVVGSIVSRRHVGGEVVYGLRYDPDGTPDFEAQHASIIADCMRRRRVRSGRTTHRRIPSTSQR